MMKENMMFEHEHPFSLIDLWSEQMQREAESEDNEEENDDLPPSLEDICEVGHTLDFIQSMNWMGNWNCKICDKCDACGKEHKGNFYHCFICLCSKIIHSHCAFLPQKMQIQDTTNDVFSHIHHLTLAYSFPIDDQISKNWPGCRVCRNGFGDKPNLWMYKCEKCRYYTHLDCATSRDEPFMSILKSPGTSSKNYKDDEHLDLLHLPFPDPSYSILKHLFSKEKRLSTLEISNKVTYKAQGIIHKHPLILEGITIPTSSRKKSISYHDPMKRIQLLCDVCVRPIMSGPIYVCADEVEEHCNFVLHEWCSRLPTKLKDHFHHPHPLILHSKTPGDKFFGVFTCDICALPCNGFAYSCEECKYYIDVKCAFLPEEITHASHPNHLLSRVNCTGEGEPCSMCCGDMNGLIFSCHTCDNFRVHSNCALLIPETTTHKCDKHPMKLSYFPIENHKSDYFCEICEQEFDPELTFYHCRECMQSIHTACAPSILRYETYTTRGIYGGIGIHKFVNVKFGGRYENTEVHPHPLSFVQGIEDDGQCAGHDCDDRRLKYSMIFKCLDCKFVLHYECCESMSSRYI
ncbi:putative chromatin regulator PHD family [Helianthus annuus]|nr:putative chromatin regulator PHD family [Helianthus annuus]